MALTVRQEYELQKQRALRDRVQKRRELRARHGIKLGFDGGEIMAALRWMFTTPAHEQDRVYARLAERLRPQRELLDHHASLARLDCDTERRSTPKQYRPASHKSIERRLAVMAKRQFEPHYNVVVGLAAAYNAKLPGHDGIPFVFMPGAFARVRECETLAMVEHHETLTLDGARLHLENDYGVGLWATIMLPHTQLGIDAARSLRAGELCGMSICWDALNWAIVDGVREIYRAAVYEITLTERPRQSRCMATLAQQTVSLSSRYYFGATYDERCRDRLAEQIAECDAVANY